MKRSDELEESILLLKKNGLTDCMIIEGLENPPSGNEGFSKEEISRAFQNLRNYGLIDNNGLITDAGIDSLY
jgi:HrpA-like RNA helicase